MTTQSYMPLPVEQAFDDAGVPLSGGKLYTYEPGTFNPKTTYSTPDGTVANSNPIILDGGGRCAIFATGEMRMILNDKDGNTIYDHVGRVLQDVTYTTANAGALITTQFYAGRVNEVVQYDHLVDPRTTKVRVRMWGGGGGGGAGCAGIGGQFYSGGGGGAGCYIELWRFNIAPNSGFVFSFTFQSGSGPHTPIGQTAIAGGSTYLADNNILEIIATAGGGQGGGSTPGGGAGGQGGVGSFIQHPNVYAWIYGGEWGGDGQNGFPINGAGVTVGGGNGGNSTLGGAGRAGVGPNGGQGGMDAWSYGSGGGGAYASTSLGGTGSPGAIWFEEYSEETVSLGGSGDGAAGDFHVTGTLLSDSLIEANNIVAHNVGINALDCSTIATFGGLLHATGNVTVDGNTHMLGALNVDNGLAANTLAAIGFHATNATVDTGDVTQFTSTTATVHDLTVTGNLNWAGLGSQNAANNVLGPLTVSGQIHANAGIVSNGDEIQSFSVGLQGAGGQFRAGTGINSVIFRNDGGTFYILDSATPNGGWTDHRPFYFDLHTGEVDLVGNGSALAIHGPTTFVDYNGSLLVSPTGNPTIPGLVGPTATGLNIQGVTQHSSGREVLVNIGLESTQGAAGNNPGELSGSGDKVPLYAGSEALSANSGNLWAANFLINISSTATNVIGTGLEIDVNNASNDRGNDFAHPIFGLQVTGVSTACKTTAILVAENPGMWARGIFAGNDCIRDAFIEDQTNSPVVIKVIGGTHVSGLDTQNSNTAIPLAMRDGQFITWNHNGNAISDVVDTNGNRLVGTGSASVYTGGAGLYPLGDGNQNLGASGNRWANVYAVNGVIQTSDMTLKTNVQPLAPMLDVVNAIDPISFSWKDGTRTHYGFSAQAIKAAFDTHELGDFGGYVESDGIKSLRPDQLVPVLWKALRELSDEVRKLKQG